MRCCRSAQLRIVRGIMDISSMLEVEVKEMKEELDIKENVTPSDLVPSMTTSMPIPQEELNFYKFMFCNDIASVRYRRLHCTACDTHIGSAPTQIHNMFEHPVLRTLLCAKCREFYGDGAFEQGDDATDMFCRWCANGGNLYCCSYCSNTFCYKCIKRNFASVVRRKIEADEKWKCFVCDPLDLYNARGVCWALLQHVQTVTRILLNEKKMTPQEICEKMNLDESSCCSRRSKRIRRRVESNSEDEDDTYAPKTNGLPMQMTQKQIKKVKLINQPKCTVSNGINTKQLKTYSTAPIPVKSRPSSLWNNQIFEHTEQQSRINCEKSAINSKNIIPSPSNVINSNVSLSSRYDPKVSPVFRKTVMNAAASSTCVQPPTTHKIILSKALSQMSRYQLSQPLQSNAMVSIPNSTNNLSKSRFLLPKPKSKVMLNPNVIELDSDSDDESKAAERNNSAACEDNNADAKDTSKIVVPVALVSTENSCDDGIGEEQSLREMCTSLEKDTVSFSQMMLPHSQELEKLTSDIQKKVHSFFAISNDDVYDIESIAQQKVKQFYQKMRNTVTQLAHINDRVVREYNKWKRSRKTSASSLDEHNTLASQENIKIPLDMVCVNDSDTESVCDKSEYRVIEPSDLVKTSNVVKDLLFFKKIVVDRGIGESALLSEDKAVQVYDIVSRDYEKCISYSLLTKADYNPQTKDNVLKPVTVFDKNFDKYQEQFIFYLQHHDIETEDKKRLSNPNETPLKDLIETNSPFISKFLPNINSPDILIKSSQNHDSIRNANVNAVIDNLNTDVVASTMASKNDKETTQVTNDLIIDTRVQKSNIQFNEGLQQNLSVKIHDSVSNDKVTSMILNNNDASSSVYNIDEIYAEVTAMESEEDCTIIDD